MKVGLFERLGRAPGGLMIHGIDSSAITEAVTEIVILTKQRDALLAVVKMRQADGDPEVSFEDFFAIVNSYGRVRGEESAVEFMERLSREAIALCPEVKPVSITEAFEELRESGGKSWDSVADPERYLSGQDS